MKKFLKNSLITIMLLMAMLVGCAMPIEDDGDVEDLPIIEQEAEADDETIIVPTISKEEAEEDSDEGQQDQQDEWYYEEDQEQEQSSNQSDDSSVSRDGEYTSKEEVALYIHLYGELPSNYITKKEAKALGWESKEGNLWEVAPGKSIGGDKFGNYEGLLPEASGRKYYECDIDTNGSYRGAKRIVFSNDGLVYYTGDHYESFELLYGEE